MAVDFDVHDLLDAVLVGIVAVDRAGRIRFVNRTGARIDQLDPNKVIGQPLEQVYPETPLLEVLRSGAPRVGELFMGPQGYGITNQSPIVRNGAVVGAVAAFLDGAELEMAVARTGRLERMYAELEAIFQALQDDITVFDAQGRMIRGNQATARFLGCRLDELLGRSTYELEQAGYFSPSLTRLVLERRETVTALQTTRDGRQFITTGSPVFDRDGNLIMVVNTARDVTELQQLRDQLAAVADAAASYRHELEELRRAPSDGTGLVARSPAMQRVMALAEKTAGFDTSVLLLGESGVGKNALALQIHKWSRRAGKPFVEINCGAIPEALLESELFGYEGGAFTGARKQGKAGQMELADGGTLFLNEIGELPLPLQVKLLKVLQNRTLTRVGGIREIKMDVRVIAATNLDLEAMVAARQYRADLYFRLNVVPIRIPPLRERKEDRLPLILTNLERLSRLHGVRRRMGPGVLDALLAYHWPGNVRELENTVERLVVTAQGETITVEELPEALRASHPEASVSEAGQGTLAERMAAVERRILLSAYKELGSTHRMARALGISQSTAARKLRHYLGEDK